jgi:hypothetical protein
LRWRTFDSSAKSWDRRKTGWPSAEYNWGVENFLDKPPFAIATTSDPECRIFHTRMILTDHVCVGVSGCDNVAELVEGILDFVMRLPGVVQAQVERHKLTVVKSPMFSWDEIEEPLVELLRFSKLPELLRFPCPNLPAAWLPHEE